MNALVLYDTNFGNTKKAAEAIAETLGAAAVSVSNVKIDDLGNYGLIVVGSPIVGWRPSEKMIAFLAGLGAGRLKNIKAAAFDTRVKLFIHGDAAEKILRSLEGAGAEIAAEPGSFYVKGKEGPLLDGEIEKAKAWAALLKTKSGG
ncbi:MAG: flavodoxin family protein [Candidatus Aminicenantales bacterium]